MGNDYLSMMLPLQYNAGASIDKLYGPWASFLDFTTYLSNEGTTVKEGMHIGIKDETGRISDYVYQRINGAARWVKLGGVEDIPVASADNDGLMSAADKMKLDAMGTGGGGATVNVTGMAVFDTVASLKYSTGLKAGDTVMTKGFYAAGDGGGSTYIVRNQNDPAFMMYIRQGTPAVTCIDATWTDAMGKNSTPFVDGATLIQLSGGLYADLLVPADRVVSFKQLGARTETRVDRYDCKPYMLRWLAFMDRHSDMMTLLMPRGIWAFSDTWILRGSSNHCHGGIRIVGESHYGSKHAALIAPYLEEQDFIWRLGSTEGSGVMMEPCEVSNLCFCSNEYDALSNAAALVLYGDNGSGKAFTNAVKGRIRKEGAALYLDYCPYSKFDNLYFDKVEGTSMKLVCCYECSFGYINIRRCGGIFNGLVPPMVYFAPNGASAISACYFNYFNIECCVGTYFYGKMGGSNFAHCEFNNIQVEGNLLAYGDAHEVIAVDPKENSGKTKEPLDGDEGYVPNAVGNDYKMFVFAGSIGVSPIFVNNVSVTNFGNGVRSKRYVLPSNDGGYVDGNGYTYEQDEVEYDDRLKKYYACIIKDGQKVPIVDTYRHYAVIGTGDNGTKLSNGDPIRGIDGESYSKGGSTVITLNNFFLWRSDNLGGGNGPWLVYSKECMTTHNIKLNCPVESGTYPFYLNGAPAVKCIETSNMQFGCKPAYLFANSALVYNHIYTKSGAWSAGGMCVKVFKLSNASMYAMKMQVRAGMKYRLRVFIPNGMSDSLQTDSTGTYFMWGSSWYLDNALASDSTKQYVTAGAWNWLDLPAGFNAGGEAVLRGQVATNSSLNNVLQGMFIDVVEESINNQ